MTQAIRRIPFLCFALFCGMAHADDGYFAGAGMSVYPLTTTQVRMMAEKVRLKRVPSQKEEDIITAECEFRFLNNGGEKTITMGFPAESSEFSDNKPTLIMDFKTFIENAPVSVKLQKVEDLKASHGIDLFFDHAYTWKAHFKAHQTLLVRNTYRFKISGGQDNKAEGPEVHPFPGFMPSESFFYYILKTGALWAGTIGTADLSVDLGEDVPEELLDIKPAGYSYKDGVISWNLKDLKPTEDVQVIIHDGPLRPMKGSLTYDSIETYLDMGDVGVDERDAKVKAAFEKLDQLQKEVETGSTKYPAEDRGKNLYIIGKFRKFLEACRTESWTLSEKEQVRMLKIAKNAADFPPVRDNFGICRFRGTRLLDGPGKWDKHYLFFQGGGQGPTPYYDPCGSTWYYLPPGNFTTASHRPKDDCKNGGEIWNIEWRPAK